MTHSTSITIYTFQAGEEAHAIRVLMRDDAPWFVAADVCRAIDLGNPSMALDRLDDDEKGLNSIDTLGGRQNVQTVTEAGLYSLVLSSRKPEAKPFKRWITHEVLPAIARHGAYVDSNNRMGQALGAATDGAVQLDAPATAGDAHAIFAGVAAMNAALAEQQKLLKSTLERIERDREGQTRRESAMRAQFARELGRIVRVTKAHKPNNRNADPNRPLDEDDVERFKYLLSTGATAKQIARSLHRTYAVVQRFIDTNQDLVIRALQHSLL